MTTKVTSKDNI